MTNAPLFYEASRFRFLFHLDYASWRWASHWFSTVTLTCANLLNYYIIFAISDTNRQSLTRPSWARLVLLVFNVFFVYFCKMKCFHENQFWFFLMWNPCMFECEGLICVRRWWFIVLEFDNMLVKIALKVFRIINTCMKIIVGMTERNRIINNE